MNIHTQIYHSPCGNLILGSYEGKLCLCDWLEGKNPQGSQIRLEKALNTRLEDTSSETTQKAAQELDEYFQKRRKVFDLPLLFVGSEFQKKVWNGLLSVPYGETRSYKWLAELIGNPKAVRAVGLANGANPISIFAPCHRIIGANRSLIGYGGGLGVKRFLLNLENDIVELFNNNSV